MSQSEDHTFLRQFGVIIAGLVLLTIVLIFVARSMQSQSDASNNPSLKANMAERISPVSGVRTDAEGATVPAEAPATAVQAADAPASAESTVAKADGEKVYNGLCIGCHAAAVAGAPIANSEQMSQRLSEKGFDTLMTNAINGFNVMPPRGGNPGLTDEQIRAAIEFMLP